MLRQFRKNTKAESNRAMLQAVALVPHVPTWAPNRAIADAKQLAREARVKDRKGRRASKLLARQYQADKLVLDGTAIPNQEASERILAATIKHLAKSGIYGYTKKELLQVVPILAMLSQVEGKGDFYVVTLEEITAFIGRLGQEGWHPGRFPLPLGPADQCPVRTKIRCGVCTEDLPPSSKVELDWRKEEKATLARGEPWEQPEWHQSNKHRKQGAPVHLHMTSRKTLPTFDYKDTNGALVAEDAYTPDSDDESMIVNVILARDSKEHELTLSGNTAILVRACKYLLFTIRSPNLVTAENELTAPTLPITFESLGMHNPVYQFTIFDNLARRLGAALDELEGVHAANKAVMPQGADLFSPEAKANLVLFKSMY